MKNRYYCIGIIETHGLATALEVADSMLKLGQVELFGVYFIGGGYVAVIIKGEIASVQSAVQAGVASAEKKGKVLNRNVIPRCEGSLIDILQSKNMNLWNQT